MHAPSLSSYRSSLRSFAAALVVTSLPIQAFADEPRYTTVFLERVDGATSDASSAEIALTQALVEAGVAFVDEAQSRKIRSVTDAGRLLDGGIPPVITTLDADVIVAGLVNTSQVPRNELLPKNVLSYSATIEAKIIAVDTGRVLAAYSTDGTAVGFSARQAAQAAARAVGDKLGKIILEKRAGFSRGRNIELLISGIPNVATGAKLVARLREVSGVKRADVAHSGRGATKLVVESNGLSIDRLALALDEAGVGLTVFGFSDGSIRAEYSAARALALRLVVSDFRAAHGQKSWRGRTIAGLVGATLANSELLTLADGKQNIELPDAPERWAKVLGKMDLPVERTLVLLGSYEEREAKVELEARVVAAASRGVLLSERRTCKVEELSPCAAALGESLMEKLPGQISNKGARLLEGALEGGSLARASSSTKRKPLDAKNIEARDVFPARIAAYANDPLGFVTLHNRGKERIQNVVVSAEIPKFTTGRIDVAVGTMAPDEQKRIALPVVLDHDALVAHDENRPAVLEVGMSYEVGDLRVTDARSKAVIVYDRNALDWREPSSVAAFVSARDEPILRLARAAYTSVPKRERPHPLAKAVALFRAMGLAGLRYAPDPVNPLQSGDVDYIQYPVQTLVAGGGDCDDLAVLLASLAEAVGIGATLVTTPGHVFVALETELLSRSANVVADESHRLLEHEGSVWVPIETTAIGRSFDDAWSEASRAIDKARERHAPLGLIGVRKAWERFAPVSLVRRDAVPALPEMGQLGTSVDRELDAMDRARKQNAERAISALDNELEKARGERRNELLSKKGVLLVAAGNMSEARSLFAESARTTAMPIGPKNNLGNIELLGGQVDEARAHYNEALALAPKNVKVRMNAAIAAWIVHDDDAFGEHIAICLEQGAVSEVEGLAHATLSARGQVAGADRTGRSKRELTDLVRRAIIRSGRTPSAKLGATTTRASEVGAGSEATVEPYLHWL